MHRNECDIIHLNGLRTGIEHWPLPTTFQHTACSATFLPEQRDASELYAVAVCASHASIVSKQLNRLSRFLHTVYSLLTWNSRVFLKIKVLPSGTCYQTLYLKKFATAHELSHVVQQLTVASVSTFV